GRGAMNCRDAASCLNGYAAFHPRATSKGYPAMAIRASPGRIPALSGRLVPRSLDEGKGTRTSSFESRSISAGRMTEFFVSFAWCKNNHARSLSEFCRGQTGTRKGAEHKETKLAKRALAFPIPTGLKLGPAPSTAPWQAILKGLQSLSPGLRG